MFTVKLKDGTITKVDLEEMEQFLKDNRDLIGVQTKVMGKRRG